MGTTANGLPYPTDNSTFDPPAHLTALASALDRKTVGVFATTADRDLAYPTPSEGQIAYTQTDDVLWLYRAGTWRKLFYDSGWLTLTPNSPFIAGPGGIHYTVLNGVCHWQMDVQRTVSSWTDPISIITFPAGVRPPWPHYYFALRQGTSAEAAENLTIATNGVMTLGTGGANGDHIYSSGTFPVG